jgi:hypothetical protein
MPRIPRVRRHLAAILTSLALAAAVLLPVGGAVRAASTSPTCPPEDVGTTCQLVISAPQSVPTGVSFVVNILVTTDGTTVATGDPCASRVAVTLEIYYVDGPTVYGPVTVNAKKGVATFSPTLASAESYEVEAYVNLDGPDTCGNYYDHASQSVTAVTIPAGQALAPCPPGVPCVQTLSGTGSGATLIGSDPNGFFVPFFTPDSYWASLADSGLGAGCGAPADPGQGVLGFTYFGSGSKTIVFSLASSLVTKGIGRFNICWNSAMQFTVLGGGLAAQQPDGTYTGELPKCGPKDTGPCVLYKTSGQHNVGFFAVFAPPGDPRGYVN